MHAIWFQNGPRRKLSAPDSGFGVSETSGQCLWESTRIHRGQSETYPNMRAKRANIHRPKEWFKVLQTTERSQTAVMKLGAGQSTGKEAEAHEGSEQILLLIEGELAAEIEGRRSRMKPGDVVVIPPRIRHKFTNRRDKPALTFNVCLPPEYPIDDSRRK